ncbi:MAG: GNAT family N-acetyltransferase [Woeseiaceae bacterium]
MAVEIRVATMDDCQAIERIIAESARVLGKPDYSDDEIEAALKGPWGLDTQLVKDSTYFLVYVDGELAACGGWSFRATLFGSDAEASRDAARLDPGKDAARIRAFFVRPGFARQGIGTSLLQHCEAAAKAAGFRSLSLGSTLPGQRLYAVRGFVAGDPIDYDLGDGLSMLVIPMTKQLKT